MFAKSKKSSKHIRLERFTTFWETENFSSLKLSSGQGLNPFLEEKIVETILEAQGLSIKFLLVSPR